MCPLNSNKVGIYLGFIGASSLSGILFLPDVYSLMLCILAYKVFHNLSVPYSICSLFNRIQHSHSTRVASHNFFVTCTRLKIYHDSPILSGIYTSME